MENKEIVLQLIGAFVVSAILIAIPILCALSYALLWYDGIRFLLTICTAGMYLWIVNKIMENK